MACKERWGCGIGPGVGWRRTRLGVLVVSVVLATLGFAPAAFATGWTPPAAIDGGNLLTSVSCTSSSFCVAADEVGNVFVFNGSSWSAADSVFGSAGTYPQIFSVSCASGTEFCAVSGEVKPPNATELGAVATYNDGTWSAPKVYGQIGNIALYVDELGNVSCASPTSCVATDKGTSSYVTWNGGQWSQPMPVGSNFGEGSYNPSLLSCPTSSFCAGVDSYAAENYNGSMWSAPVTVASDEASLFAISCPSASFCMATASDGDAYTYNGSTWSGPSMTGTGINPWGVSCVSSSFCVAVDQSGDAGYYNGSKWTDSDTFDSANPTSVSCATTTFCVEVDQTGDVSYFSGVPAAQSTGSATDGAGTGTTSTSAGSSATPSEPSVALALTHAIVSAGKLRITLRCTGTTKTHCAKATVAATVTEHLTGTRVTAVTARARKRTKTVTIATASVTLTAGQSATLSLSLNGTGSALLARHLHLATTVRVTSSGHTIGQRTLHLTATTKHKA